MSEERRRGAQAPAEQQNQNQNRGGGGRGGRGPMGPMIIEKPKDLIGTLKRLIGYVGRDRILLFSLIGIVVVVTLLGLVGPALQGKAIDIISLENGEDHVDVPALVQVLLIMGGTYLLQAGINCTQGILAAKLSRSTVRSLSLIHI